MASGIKLTNEEFLQRLKDKDVQYKPLEEYKNYITKIKWLCYKNSKHIFEASPYTILNGHGCPYCCNQKVFVGENDMWTTNPELAAMLKNPEDGYKYTDMSSKRVNWICKNCNSIIKDKVINEVNKRGLCCPVCSDNISFGEKYIQEMLRQLNCEFVHDRTINWSDCRRYDFYISSMNMIIETHGLQHYEESRMGGRTLKEEQENDKYKKELAVLNGIKHYIVLDCRESNDDYVKNSILSSELSILFDLSSIDWQKCFDATLTSMVVFCADLWVNGMKSTDMISEYTGIHISHVINYLKKAAKGGLCDYIPYYHRMKSKEENIKNVCNLWDEGIHNDNRISEILNLSRSYVSMILRIHRRNKII